MDEYAFGLEDNEFVIAFLDEESLEKAIARGRKLEPLTSDEAREIMIEQLTELYNSEDRGYLGDFLYAVDAEDVSTNDIFSEYVGFICE